MGPPLPSPRGAGRRSPPSFGDASNPRHLEEVKTHLAPNHFCNIKVSFPAAKTDKLVYKFTHTDQKCRNWGLGLFFSTRGEMLPRRGQRSRAIPTGERIHAEMRSPGGTRCSQPFILCPHTQPSSTQCWRASLCWVPKCPPVPLCTSPASCAQTLVAPHRVLAPNRQLPSPTTPVSSRLDSKSSTVGTSPRFLKRRGNLWCNKYDLK